MNVRRALFRFSRALERQIVPGLDCSQHTYESCLRDQVRPTHAWLDIGCGHARRSTSEEGIVRISRLVGVDLKLPAVALASESCLSFVVALVLLLLGTRRARREP